MGKRNEKSRRNVIDSRSEARYKRKAAQHQTKKENEENTNEDAPETPSKIESPATNPNRRVNKSSSELKLTTTPVKERTPKKEPPTVSNNITVDSPLFKTPSLVSAQTPETLSTNSTSTNDLSATKNRNVANSDSTVQNESANLNSNGPKAPRCEVLQMQRLWEKKTKDEKQRLLQEWKRRDETIEEDLIKDLINPTFNKSLSEVSDTITMLRKEAIKRKEEMKKTNEERVKQIEKLDDHEFRAHRRLMMMQIQHQELENLVSSDINEGPLKSKNEKAENTDTFLLSKSQGLIRLFFSIPKSCLESILPFELRLNRICDIYADSLSSYRNHVSMSDCFLSRVAESSEEVRNQKGLFVLHQSAKLLEKIKQKLYERNKMYFPNEASNKSWNRNFKCYEKRVCSLKETAKNLCTLISNEESKIEELRKKLINTKEENENETRNLSEKQISYDNSVLKSPCYKKALKDGEKLNELISKTKARNKSVLELVEKAKNDQKSQLENIKYNDLMKMEITKEAKTFEEELEKVKIEIEERQNCHDAARQMLHQRSKRVLYEEGKKEELKKRLEKLRLESAAEIDQLQLRHIQHKSICRKLKYFVKESRKAENKVCKIALLNDSEDFNIKSLVLCS